MELFLNALWLACSAGAIIALLPRRYCLTERKQFLPLASALCAAALAFPSISISDDIHLDAFVVEDSGPAKRLTRAVAHATPIASASWFGSAILLLVSLVPDTGTRPLIERCPSVNRTTSFIHDLMGRAPPRSFAYCP